MASERDESAAEPSMPNSSSTTSGSASAAVPKTSLSTASGLASVAAPKTSSSTTSGSAGADGVRKAPMNQKGDLDLSNPWNKFQHEHAGKGLSKQTLSKMYRYHKYKNQ